MENSLHLKTKAIGSGRFTTVHLENKVRALENSLHLGAHKDSLHLETKMKGTGTLFTLKTKKKGTGTRFTLRN